MHTIIVRFSVSFALLIGASIGFGVAHAGDWMHATPVPDNRLDTVRGGFDAGGGLFASFGIERAVYINGQLVTQTSINIPDIGRLNTAQAAALAQATQTASVVQNGSGNLVDPGLFTRATSALVIQNTLDNQSIQGLTTIHVAVNSLPLFSGLNLQQALQPGLVQSLGH